MYSVRTELTEYKCINLIKIAIEFVAKLLNYRILFKDILTCLGLDYNFVVIGISIPKIRYINYNIQIVVKKVQNQYDLNSRTDFLITIIECNAF